MNNMKTAEEWNKVFPIPVESHQLAFIEAIQADATHAALTEAAEICVDVAKNDFNAGGHSCKKAIIALRDKKP